jgi:arginine decarboxylase
MSEAKNRTMIPKEFFVTSGKALSNVSKLNAFDQALENAGIGQCNLVPVSSILPPKCKEIKWRKMPVGSITHIVMARMDGEKETTIGAGVAWAWEKNKKYGIVAEAYGYMGQKALEEALEIKVKEMAIIRKIQIGEITHCVEVLKIPDGKYGCAVAALVYVP